MRNSDSLSRIGVKEGDLLRMLSLASSRYLASIRSFCSLLMMHVFSLIFGNNSIH